jgi:hypothetical protein
MSNDLKHAAVSALEPPMAAEPFCIRRLDRIDQPARSLGAKRAALQVRRLSASKKPSRPKDGPPVCGALTLVSQDQTVTFTLRGTALGLVMERTQRQTVGTRLVQVMVFTNPPAFERWCAFEPMRFEDALLYSHLRREGHAALTAKP